MECEIPKNNIVKNLDFNSLDEVILNAIDTKTFPSATILVGNSDKIIYEKAYGKLTYDDPEISNETTLDTFYDIASLSKVVGTTSAVMKLYDQRLIQLEDLVVKYIPEFDNNGKNDITILNLLIHNSGISAHQSLYLTCQNKKEILETLFNSSKEYETGSKTVYSCLGYIILGEIIERITKCTLDVFLKEHVFGPLNMTKTLYNPLDNGIDKSKIAPTEFDNNWRKRLTWGVVHDENAYAQNGVSANAGLFSTVEDIYAFMKMMLNEGKYIDQNNKEERLFTKETVELFTKRYEGCPYNNTRALGWDTIPPPSASGFVACGTKLSKNSFGHTGFTGTSIWADKDKDLVIIILTNRVYPTRDHPRIFEFRSKTHDEVCQIMGY